MNLSKNGRKTQKAICKALMLGLPVAGLLATAGCGKESATDEERRQTEEAKRKAVEEARMARPMGMIIDPRCLEEERRQAQEAFRKAEAEAIRRTCKGEDDAAKNSSLP